MAVGAPWEDFDHPNQGCAFVYDISLSTEQAIRDSEHQISASDKGQHYEEFGISVDLSGDTIIVGAINADRLPDPNDKNEGAAYIYERQSDGTWDETNLVDPNLIANDHFGSSVSISGDIAVVGAKGVLGVGKAIIFERNSAGTWNFFQTLTPDDGQNEDDFGTSVSISGNFIVVGASSHDSEGVNNAGKAYVFERVGNTWTEVDKLVATDVQVGGVGFGSAVCVHGETAVIGRGAGVGAAFMYSLESLAPSSIPSMSPSAADSEVPSMGPSLQPSVSPSLLPSSMPSSQVCACALS